MEQTADLHGRTSEGQDKGSGSTGLSIGFSTQHPLQTLDDPLRRPTVPFRRNRSFLPPPCHQSSKGGRELVGISSDEFVGSDRDRFRPFELVT